MNLRLHLVRDHVDDLCYVSTERKMADPMTKALAGHKYLRTFNLRAKDKTVLDDTHADAAAFYVVVEH